ncbi:MAG: phosphotransferase [Lachnospiraceae bacterium]|nr:phosphotransferase [Lachnospiraceae bacterium]
MNDSKGRENEVNDRAVSVLEQYDLTVLRTMKARSAMILETTEGIRILKEYEGPCGKLQFLNELLRPIEEETGIFVDYPIPDREGNFSVCGRDGLRYVVKTHILAKECDPVNEEEMKRAAETMAKLHLALKYKGNSLPGEYRIFRLADETRRLSRELVHIRKYLSKRKQKCYFEQELLRSFPYYEEKAGILLKEMETVDFEGFYQEILEQKQFAHGDFQYHNCQFADHQPAVLNFEKCRMDSGVRDLSLFLRKTLEKADWSPSLLASLLNAYEQVSPLNEAEYRQLYFRLAFPEKFRKISNFYMNSNKAFISTQLLEKLELLKLQERKKETCLNLVFK